MQTAQRLLLAPPLPLHPTGASLPPLLEEPEEERKAAATAMEAAERKVLPAIGARFRLSPKAFRCLVLV